MCDTCTDPREAILDASKAIRGLQQLLADRPHVVAGDAELPVLVDVVARLLEPAARRIQSYVPA